MNFIALFGLFQQLWAFSRTDEGKAILEDLTQIAGYIKSDQGKEVMREMKELVQHVGAGARKWAEKDGGLPQIK